MVWANSPVARRVFEAMLIRAPTPIGLRTFSASDLRGTLHVLGFSLWLLALSVGTATMLSRAFASSDGGLPPARLPAVLTRVNHTPVLLLFAHPQCPCTRASLAGLEDILASVTTPVHARVLMCSPDGMPRSWVEAENWQSAAAIAGVHVEHDSNGAFAKQFQVATSGHTVVYDASGRLAFAGGITAARGHGGQSVGRDAVVRILKGESLPFRTTPVFGCALFRSGNT